MDRSAGVQIHPIQAPDHVLVVGVDEPHPEPCQAKVLAHAPHEMGSLWIRQLKIKTKIKFSWFLSLYFLLGNAENTFKLHTLVMHG